jgi:DNA-binding NarL/FixJ family response regulator
MSVPGRTSVAVVDDEPETRRQAQAAGCDACLRKTAPGRGVLQAVRAAAKSKELTEGT